MAVENARSITRLEAEVVSLKELVALHEQIQKEHDHWIVTPHQLTVQNGKLHAQI